MSGRPLGVTGTDRASSFVTYGPFLAGPRLQLPHDFTSALAMDRRVRLELEHDHIGVWPDGLRERQPRREEEGER